MICWRGKRDQQCTPVNCMRHSRRPASQTRTRRPDGRVVGDLYRIRQGFRPIRSISSSFSLHLYLYLPRFACRADLQHHRSTAARARASNATDRDRPTGDVTEKRRRTAGMQPRTNDVAIDRLATGQYVRVTASASSCLQAVSIELAVASLYLAVSYLLCLHVHKYARLAYPRC